MKRMAFILPAVVLLIVSCEHNVNNSSQTMQPAENAETTVPGVEKLDFTDSIKLTANENMRFNKELFRVKTGKKINLSLTNTSAKSNTSMTHNVVILKSGTDIADFADIARNAKAEQYVPSSLDSLVIAHTGMAGGGERAQVDFTITRPGVYDFICSFPGHWGTMQGKIVAE